MNGGCTSPGCNSPIRSRGLCNRCYNAAYLGRSHELLAVECWCRHQIVMVTQQDVMRGRTRTCGLERCKQAVVV